MVRRSLSPSYHLLAGGSELRRPPLLSSSQDGLVESRRRAGGDDRRAASCQRRGGLRPLPRRVPPVAALLRGPARTASWTDASTRADGLCSGKRSPTLNAAASSTSPPASASGRISQSSAATTCARPPSWASSSCSTRSTYAVRLLNPLTRQVSDLPPATTLYPLYRGAYGADPRLDFEVSGAGLADDATVVVLFEEVQMLAVARLGDEQWTLVKQGTSLSPAISFAGRFYCTTSTKIKMVDTSDNQPPRLLVAAKIIHWFSRTEGTVHLLDNDGELMLLSRTFMQRIGEARYFMEYKVSLVDLDARKTQPIPDLGGHAVFIGSSCAIIVSPLAFPTIRNDCLSWKGPCSGL